MARAPMNASASSDRCGSQPKPPLVVPQQSPRSGRPAQQLPPGRRPVLGRLRRDHPVRNEPSTNAITSTGTKALLPFSRGISNPRSHRAALPASHPGCVRRIERPMRGNRFVSFLSQVIEPSQPNAQRSPSTTCPGPPRTARAPWARTPRTTSRPASARNTVPSDAPPRSSLSAGPPALPDPHARNPSAATLPISAPSPPE